MVLLSVLIISGYNEDEEVMEEDSNEEDSNGCERNLMRDVITVECRKLNGKAFIGTVNYSEAKTKIFHEGMGLDPSLLDSVKKKFNKCPVVHYKLKSKINVTESIKNPKFDFTRTYHSKGVLKTDSINWEVTGVVYSKLMRILRKYTWTA